MNLICSICNKRVTDLMSEHYKQYHPDYQWPEDWAKVGDEDE